MQTSTETVLVDAPDVSISIVPPSTSGFMDPSLVSSSVLTIASHALGSTSVIAFLASDTFLTVLAGSNIFADACFN